MTTDPTAVIREIYAIMNTRDLDAIDRLYHPNVTLNGNPSSPEEIRQYCGSFLDAFDDFVLTPEQFVTDGEWVAARVVGRGTHTGPLGDLPATGKRVEIAQHDVARVVEGKLVECFTVVDQYEMMRQLDAV